MGGLRWIVPDDADDSTIIDTPPDTGSMDNTIATRRWLIITTKNVAQAFTWDKVWSVNETNFAGATESGYRFHADTAHPLLNGDTVEDTTINSTITIVSRTSTTITLMSSDDSTLVRFSTD